MKVLLTGATGFVGTRLSKRLVQAGHEVLPVSRRRAKRTYDWSEESLGRGVHEADAIVHLAGENLFGRRWSTAQKQRLWTSRVETTRRLALLAAGSGTRCFLSTSAVGAYGPNENDVLDETSPRGADFLAELCRDWEEATDAALEAGVRTCVVRLGVVLGQEGGALARMWMPFKLGVGGPLGHGRQWFSWIHVDDLASLFLFLLEREECSGVFNGTAPEPVTMRDFARAFGRALNRPAVLPLPGTALRIALGEVSTIMLTGQNVLPRNALSAGFEFEFGSLDRALGDLVAAKGAAEHAH
jgi:hypothetical protein